MAPITNMIEARLRDTRTSTRVEAGSLAVLDCIVGAVSVLIGGIISGLIEPQSTKRAVEACVWSVIFVLGLDGLVVFCDCWWLNFIFFIRSCKPFLACVKLRNDVFTPAPFDKLRAGSGGVPITLWPEATGSMVVGFIGVGVGGFLGTGDGRVGGGAWHIAVICLRVGWWRLGGSFHRGYWM